MRVLAETAPRTYKNAQSERGGGEANESKAPDSKSYTETQNQKDGEVRQENPQMTNRHQQPRNRSSAQ